VRLFVPESAPLPVAGPLVGEQVQALLRDRDIEYRPQHALGSGDAAERTLALKGGERGRYDLLLAVPPHAPPPPPLQDTPPVNEAGWVTVNQHTLETSVPDVFAIGDATEIPLPKADVFAEGEAKATALASSRSAAAAPGTRREPAGPSPWWGWYKS